MRRLTIAVTVLILALAACNKKKGDGKAARGSGASAGSGLTNPGAAGGVAGAGSAGSGSGADPAAAGSGSAADATAASLSNKAGNCPSAVVGATTALVADPTAAGNLVLNITAKDEAATATIRKRVAHLIEVQGAPDTEIKHTGDGTGGGAGMCPVLTTRAASLSATDIEGGTAVTITPQNGATLDALRKDVELRVTKTAEWTQSNITGTPTSGGGGGIGGGKGDHGGNHSGKGTGKGKDEPKPKPTEI